MSWFRQGLDKNWAPLAIWVALLVVTTAVVIEKARGQKIETADFVLIVLVLAGPLLTRVGYLLPFLGSVKVGEFEVKFRELTKQQLRQQGEIEAAIRFLVRNFLTEYEMTQLRNLETVRPFIVQPRPELEAELRRLLALGLIRRKPNTGVRALMRVEPHDVRQHLELTEAGRKFLEMARAFETDQPRIRDHPRINQTLDPPSQQLWRGCVCLGDRAERFRLWPDPLPVSNLAPASQGLAQFGIRVLPRVSPTCVYIKL